MTIVASAVATMSLVACEQGSLVANVKKDGSLEFTATACVQDAAVSSGLEVGRNQGISIDTSGIEAGSMYIRIAKADEAPDANENATTDDKGSEADETATDVASPVSGTSHGASNAEQGDETAKEEDDGTEALEPSYESDGFVAPGTNISQAPASDGKVTFSRTFSAMEVADNEDGIVTVTDLEEGYYQVSVSADGATGTMTVRAYDLSRKELESREAERAYNRVRDIFTGISESLTGGRQDEKLSATASSDQKATSNSAD
jgi:hypothetical protein